MQNKVTYFLLVMFLIFLIVNDAAGAGETANSFFGWLGGIFTSFRDFVDALFGGDDDSLAVVQRSIGN